MKTYAGTIVTRSTSGYVDSFSMSGYTWEGLVKSLRERARHSTLIVYTGVSVDGDEVEAMIYDAADLKEMIA